MRSHFLLLTLASLFQALLVVADSTESNTGNDSGDGGQSGTAAGAEGPDTGAFQLSKGGLIAIIVVVVVVVVGGTASTILYFLAKKRQWEVRKSIARASRRVASRIATPRSARFPADARNFRKTGARVASPSPARGGKAGKAGKDRDLEKGHKDKKSTSEKGKPTMSAFEMETPVVSSWKDKLFGYK